MWQIKVKSRTEESQTRARLIAPTDRKREFISRKVGKIGWTDELIDYRDAMIRIARGAALQPPSLERLNLERNRYS